MIKKEIQVTDQIRDRKFFVAEMVQEACKYSSQVLIESGNRKLNAKSLMGMLSLNIQPDSILLISAEGDDESQAVSSIAALFS